MTTCCCLYVDDGPSVVLKDKLVRARKSHVCGECRREIKRGERYEVLVGVWEGDLRTQKTCLLCTRVRDDLMTCGHYLGAVWADLQHCLQLEDWMLPETLLARRRERAEKRKS